VIETCKRVLVMTRVDIRLTWRCSFNNNQSINVFHSK